MDVDPWAIVVRFGKWYLLGWSHTADARRILRIDRIAGVEELAETFEAPADLDPVPAIEEHLVRGLEAQDRGRRRRARRRRAVLDAPQAGLVEPIDEQTSRIRASTDELDWYAERLAVDQARRSGWCRHPSSRRGAGRRAADAGECGDMALVSRTENRLVHRHPRSA